MFGAAAAAAGIACAVRSVHAQNSAFEAWVEKFRARAIARGVSDATYTRVMVGLKPDTSVYALRNNQDEFKEQLWQYLNRRASDWRITTGKERAQGICRTCSVALEQDYGVDRYILLSLWGIESSYGDVIDNPKYMRPVIPALAALAFGEPRRRNYWEAELLNALVIVERGWSDPKQMIGSWAGAMGHTQWMPEVWLHIGVDYNKDGRVLPFGPPDDALAGSARYLVERGRYRRGESWGCEVKLPAGFNASTRRSRSYAQWRDLGVTRADGAPSRGPQIRCSCALPVERRPGVPARAEFLRRHELQPGVQLRARGRPSRRPHPRRRPACAAFPGGERTPTLAEIQEIQRRLTALGYDTGGTDGRVGRDTMRAAQAFQRKVGMTPADGYPGLALLARLRKGA